MNLPEKLLGFHQKHRRLSHLAYWSIVLLVGVSSSRYRDGREGTYWFEFLSDGLYLMPEILAAYALAYWVIPAFLYRRQYLRAVVGFLLVGYVSCVLDRLVIVKICEPLVGIAPNPRETYTNILTDIPKLLYVYFFQIMAMAFIFVVLKFAKDHWQIQQRALMLEKEKAEAELKLLKAQLNPHFLFNTLNNIYSLSFISAAKTSDSIARLASILDYILYRGNQAFVPLSAELAVIKNYIELERLRYDSRLTVNFAGEVEQDIPIVPMVLLSLVENAFKHGASEDAGEPEVDIRLSMVSSRFCFRISNTVAERPGGRSGGGRIGLTNLQKQLDLVYGDHHDLVIEQGEGRFSVHLSIHYESIPAGYEKSKVFAGG